MKIIINNFDNTIEERKEKENKFKKINVLCDECYSQFCIETIEDLKELNGDYEQFGILFVDCPCCGKRTATEKSINLNKDNIQFPKHFYKFDVENERDIKIKDEEIKKSIKDGINYLRKNNNNEYNDFWYQSGQYFVFIQRLDDDECYYIMVTKSYYDTTIDFENEDYLS